MSDIGFSQRDSVKQISPPFLQGPWGEKYLYNLGLADDALLEKLNQAMRAHMPKVCDASALPYLGADRVLSQGPFETTASFRVRLQTSFDAWQRAGSRRAVLQQVLGFMSGTQGTTSGTVPLGAIVSTSAAGTWATWDTQYNTSTLTNPPAHASVTSSNWNWDGVYQWWRAWLVLYFQSNSAIGPEGTWGSGDTWGDASASWGTNQPVSTWQLLRSLVTLWKGGNTYYPFFILNFGGSTGVPGSEFSPNSAQGSGNPNGTWGTWATNVGGVMVASRATDSRYVDGTGVWNAAVASVPIAG